MIPCGPTASTRTARWSATIPDKAMYGWEPSARYTSTEIPSVGELTGSVQTLDSAW